MLAVERDIKLQTMTSANLDGKGWHLMGRGG